MFIRWIKRLLSKPKHDLKETRIGGHSFYTFDDVRTIPVSRKKAYFVSLTEMDWNLLGSDLDAFIDQIRKALSENQITVAGWLVENLHAYRENSVQARVIAQMSMHIVLMDDEPVNEISAKHNKSKFDLIQGNQEIQDFFFAQAFNSMKDLNEQSNTTELLDYLKNPLVKEREKTFLRAINKQQSSEN